MLTLTKTPTPNTNKRKWNQTRRADSWSSILNTIDYTVKHQSTIVEHHGEFARAPNLRAGLPLAPAEFLLPSGRPARFAQVERAKEARC